MVKIDIASDEVVSLRLRQASQGKLKGGDGAILSKRIRDSYLQKSGGKLPDDPTVSRARAPLLIPASSREALLPASRTFVAL